VAVPLIFGSAVTGGGLGQLSWQKARICILWIAGLSLTAGGCFSGMGL